MSDQRGAHVPPQDGVRDLDDAEHARLVAVVTATSTRGTAAMRRLWDGLVAAHGADAASRVWQEALASSDVGQT
jgi:hypothetical protein